MIRIITLSIIVFSALMSEEIPIGSAMPGSDFIVKNINSANDILGRLSGDVGLLKYFSNLVLNREK